MNALIHGLAEEKVVLCKTPLKLPFALRGIVRLIDKSGRTLGLVLSAEAREDIAEDGEVNSKFLASLDESRRSGRVSSSAVKKRLGLK